MTVHRLLIGGVDFTDVRWLCPDEAVSQRLRLRTLSKLVYDGMLYGDWSYELDDLEGTVDPDRIEVELSAMGRRVRIVRPRKLAEVADGDLAVHLWAANGWVALPLSPDVARESLIEQIVHAVRSLRDGTSPEPVRVAVRLAGLAAALAAEAESGETWRRDLVELAATAPRGKVVTYALGLVWAGVRSRAAWCLRRAAVPLRALLSWILRSQARTWTVLYSVLFWGGLETVRDTGLGAAIVLVLTGGLGFHALVGWARTRLGVQVESRTPKPAPGRDDVS